MTIQPPFQPDEKIMHVKTGGFYRIVCTARVEATLEDVYVYQALRNMTYWTRPRAEMLDGRFVRVQVTD
jgi:hypothetical protein